MSECLPDFPRYINQGEDGCWYGADDREGPWRPIPAPQSGLPWPTPPATQDPSAVQPTPADRLALAVCRARAGTGPCHVSEICNTCRRSAAAVAHELAEQVVPDGPKPSADSDYHLMCWSKVLDQHAQRQQTRAEIFALAVELEGANG